MNAHSQFAKLAAPVALGALLCATGCTGFSNKPNGGSSQAQTTFLYAGLENEEPGAIGCIAQYQIASDGTLTALNPPIVPAQVYIPFGGGNPLAVDSSSNYLLLAGFGNYGQVSQFVIGNDGTLSVNSPAYADNVMLDPLSFNLSATGLAVVTNGPVLNSYSLAANGTLNYLNTASATNATSVLIDPSGRFLYADDEPYSEISVYGISSDGALTLNGTIPSAYLPWSLVFSPKDVLYSVDYGAGTITEYSIDSTTGMPTKIASFTPGIGPGSSLPQGMTFSPKGEYAYVTNQGQNTVTQFVVDATTGALSRNGSDVVTGRAPSPIVVDPSGQFAYVGTLVDSAISQFVVNSDGTLTPNGTVSGWLNPNNPVTPNWAVAFAFAQK